jgi:hypothetical protein
MKQLAYPFEIGTEQIGRLLEGVEPSFLSQQPSGSNSIHWLVGHIAGARRMLCGVLGMHDDLGMMEWSEHFNRGKPPENMARWPDVPFLLSDMCEVGEKLCEHISSMAPEEAETAVTEKGWAEDTRIWHAIGFFAWHEAYHIGQIGTVRRLLGYEHLV